MGRKGWGCHGAGLSLWGPQAAVQRAQVLAKEGERLIDMKHYAVDSIHPKCQELQHVCDHIQAALDRRTVLLGQSLELHSLLEAVGPATAPDTLHCPRPRPAQSSFTRHTRSRRLRRPGAASSPSCSVAGGQRAHGAVQHPRPPKPLVATQTPTGASAVDSQPSALPAVHAVV